MSREQEVEALIAKGEGRNLDFKRELFLSSSLAKSEFIKDIISLANSGTPDGLLVIGVSDDGEPIGIVQLEEERIQQIISSYVTPMPEINCEIIEIGSGRVPIGIISVRGNERPHKVSRGIDRLQKNEVFVRQGSVIMRATPEEIIRMNSASIELKHQRRAKEFMKIERYESALESFDQALKMRPTTDAYLGRYEVYLAMAKLKQRDFRIRSREMRSFTDLESIDDESLKMKVGADLESIRMAARDYVARALEDTSSAIMVASDEIENKFARVARLKVLLDDDAPSLPNVVREDLNWLHDHAKNTDELSEYLLLEVLHLQHLSSYFDHGGPYQGLEAMNALIEQGNDTSDVLYMRACAHYGAWNYGLALEDLEAARNKTSDRSAQLRIDREYVFFLSSIGRSRELHDLLRKLVSLYNSRELKEISEYSGVPYSDIEDLLDVNKKHRI